MSVFTLPDREILNRYAPRVQHNIIRGYHNKLATKCNYQVLTFDNEKGYTNNYYTTDDINTIISNQNEQSLKLIHCNWSSNVWHIEPLITYLNPTPYGTRKEYFSKRTASPIEKEYGYNAELIGVSINDIWQFKRVEIKRSKWCTEYLTCDFKNESISFHTSKGLFGKNKDGYFETAGAFESVKTIHLKKLSDTQNDMVKWFIGKLSHKQYNSFYDDVIDVLEQL